MLDIDASIDQSFAGIQSNPRFEPSLFAPSHKAPDGEAQFMATLEGQFQTYQGQVTAWLESGRARLADLDAALKASGVPLSQEQHANITLLIDILSEQLDQDVSAKALSLKRMRRMAREFRPHSRRVERFVLELTKRIENVNTHEIEATIDLIDWWRVIRSAYSPNTNPRKAFKGADELLAHLESL
jgi:hypothetical protein